MPNSGSSFRQLSPFTIRVPAIDYYAIPTPGQYDVAAYPYVQPRAVMSCESESGTATLIGYEEFTSPSIPPKKYRRKTFDGDTGGVCDYNPGTPGVCAVFSQKDRTLWTGYCEYDALSGILSNNTQGYYSGLSSSGPCTLLPANTPTGTFSCDVDFGDGTNPASAWAAPTITPTSKTWPLKSGCYDTGTSNRHAADATKITVITLSVEDTEADAMARASKTPGTSCLAYIEARGAGDFSFAFASVAYDILCSDLLKNRKYRLSYDLITEDYGGGNASAEPFAYLFEAGGTTKHFTGTLAPESGKQVSIQNIKIELVTFVNSGLSSSGIQSSDNHSFREIAPFTPRFVGIDYMAIPGPGNPPRSDSAYPYNYPP